MMGKLKTLKRLVEDLSILKTLFWYFKLHLPSVTSLRIFPKSIIEIDETASLAINGVLSINDSWFKTRTRRYYSEFRMDTNALCVCEGDFKLYQGASIYVGPEAKLVLRGGMTYLNTNSTINCFRYVEIGRNCAISDNVCIQDSDSHFIEGGKEKMTAPIIIEDHVWIGKNVTILKGVHIGKGAVVGAGSLVNKDVPPNTLVAGNPAKPIRDNISWH